MSIYVHLPAKLHRVVKVEDGTRRLFYGQYKFGVTYSIKHANAYRSARFADIIQRSAEYEMAHTPQVSGVWYWDADPHVSEDHSSHAPAAVRKISDLAAQSIADIKKFNAERKTWDSHRMLVSYPRSLSLFSDNLEQALYLFRKNPRATLVKAIEVVNPIASDSIRVMNSNYLYRVFLRRKKIDEDTIAVLRDVIAANYDNLHPSPAFYRWLNSSEMLSWWRSRTFPAHYVDINDPNSFVILNLVAPGYFKEPVNIVR